MTNTISILGSTGSIGRQTLDVAEQLGLRVAALTANSNVERMEAQCRKFQPRLAVMTEESAAAELKIRLRDTPVKVQAGTDALVEAAVLPEADTVVTAVVGMVGLKPTLAAIRAKKRIALANKETLVCAGELVMDEAEHWGAEIVPVDSEHSAIFQCLQGAGGNQPVRLLLTASGGPFRTWTREQMQNATRAQALKHPNWSMGAKITIDSASMFNKALEIIEAHWLFDMPPEKIQVVVHPQSIVHSAVEFADGAVLAQLGVPDMRVPIAYAMTYPRRIPTGSKPLDLFSIGTLTFEPGDPVRFPALRLAGECLNAGGAACTILNGANEMAVAAFLRDEIPFGAISRIVEGTLEACGAMPADTLEDIFHADLEARRVAKEIAEKLK